MRRLRARPRSCAGRMFVAAQGGRGAAPTTTRSSPPAWCRWLEEAIRFPTYQGTPPLESAQQSRLLKTAAGLGFATRDTGKFVEVELPGPAGAPVLGLVVHGDVQPAEAKAWSIPPFAGTTRDGMVPRPRGGGTTRGR